MKEIADGMHDANYYKIQQEANILQSTSAAVSAGRLHYACYAIHLAYTQNKLNDMIELFILLVEATIEFKRHSRKVIASLKSKFETFGKVKLILFFQPKNTSKVRVQGKLYCQMGINQNMIK